MPQIRHDDEALSRYIAAVGRFPKLDRRQELFLSRRWREHGDQEAANHLVECNLRYVVKIAAKYRGYGFRLGDLVEEGNLGLLEAVRRFEPERNLRFMTYAAYWVRAYILSFVLKHWSIVGVGTGPLQSRMFFRLQGERAKLSQRLGEQDETIDETLADKFNTTEDRVRTMRERLSGRDTSLDTPAYREGATNLVDLIPDDGKDQEQSTADAQRDAHVREVLDRIWGTLDERERLICSERLLSDDAVTLADLGRRLGLSRERVRQLEGRLKNKLRRALEPLAQAA